MESLHEGARRERVVHLARSTSSDYTGARTWPSRISGSLLLHPQPLDPGLERGEQVGEELARARRMFFGVSLPGEIWMSHSRHMDLLSTPAERQPRPDASTKLAPSLRERVGRERQAYFALRYGAGTGDLTSPAPASSGSSGAPHCRCNTAQPAPRTRRGLRQAWTGHRPGSPPASASGRSNVP